MGCLIAVVGRLDAGIAMFWLSVGYISPPSYCSLHRSPVYLFCVYTIHLHIVDLPIINTQRLRCGGRGKAVP